MGMEQHVFSTWLRNSSPLKHKRENVSSGDVGRGEKNKQAKQRFLDGIKASCGEGSKWSYSRLKRRIILAALEDIGNEQTIAGCIMEGKEQETAFADSRGLTSTKR